MILRRQGRQILRFCRRLFPDPSFTQNIFREHVFRLKSQQGGNLPPQIVLIRLFKIQRQPNQRTNMTNVHSSFSPST